MAASGLRVGRVVLVGSETMCRLQNQRPMKNALRSQLVSVSLRMGRLQNQRQMKNASIMTEEALLLDADRENTYNVIKSDMLEI